MILVLAGTLEGRQTASLLQNSGFSVTATTVTDYGAELLRHQGVEQVLAGALDELSLEHCLRQGYRLLVDATHPFAAQASQTAMNAANAVGISYLRLERTAGELPEHSLVYGERDLEHSIERALSLGKVVFSTLGSRSLWELQKAACAKGARLIARVLPDAAVLSECLKLGLSPAQIIALQGPCSQGLNVAMYRQYGAEVVLTKDSGSTGGLQEKVAAALEVGIPIVVWQRPQLQYPLVVHTPEEALDYCLKHLRNGQSI